MPACSQCARLVEGRCSANDDRRAIMGRPVSRVGACVVPIVDDYLTSIRRGMKVLEIGCGSSDRIKAHCAAVGAHYEGIDTQASYFGKPSSATRIENLAALSDPDETFDLVIGNQTMEHWAEYGCSLSWGLHQCFRVCKLGGAVYLNVPFHFHGTHHFLYGKERELRRLFARFSDDVRFEAWGHPSAPLAPVHVYASFPPMRSKPAHIVDIRAVKTKPVPRGAHNLLGCSGRLSRLVNKPLAWNAFMVARKLGLVRTDDVPSE